MAKHESKFLPLFMKFIEHIRIVSKEVVSVDSRGAQLKVWGSQRMFLEQICAGLDEGVRFFICLKSRQLGITTIMLVIDIWWLAVHDATQGALVCDTEVNSAANRATLTQYIESFPKNFFGKGFTITKSNRNFMLFSNGSRLDFLVAGKSKKSWGEGKGYSYAHITEIANFGSKEGVDSFMEALAENHPNRLVVIESTAKGMNFYKEMYDNAGRDVHTKRRMFIGFWAKELNSISRGDPRFAIYGAAEPDEEEQELIDIVKERHNFKVSAETLAWYRWRCSDTSTDIQTVHQNQPWYDSQAFVLSGYSFFRVRDIQTRLGQILDGDEETGAGPIAFRGYRLWLGNDFWSSRPEAIETMDRLPEVELRVWEDPDPNGYYVIGVDPALGRTDWGNNHAISVWRCFSDKIVQAAEYADNNVETRHCAWVLAYLAGMYENCIINIELTGGHGRAVMTELDHLREMMKAEVNEKAGGKDWQDFMIYARHYLYKKADSYGGGSLKGFETGGGRNKNEIMNQWRDSHSTGTAVIMSAPLLQEMLLVVQDGYEIGAPGREKDDRVMGAALANRAWIDGWRMPLTAQGITYKRYLDELSGDSKPGSAIVDNIVLNFFKAAEERVEEPTERQRWMAERGFVGH